MRRWCINGSHRIRWIGALVLGLSIAAHAAAEIGVWEPVGPGSGAVTGITVDPTDARRLFAVQGGDLLRSTDGGESWSPSLELEVAVVDVAVAPSDPNVVYAGTQTGPVFRSLDRGVTWAPTSPLGEIGPASPLAVDPADADHVLAARPPGFVARTTDGGSTWSLSALEGPRPFPVAFAFDPVQTSTVYLAASRRFYRSLDGGATWTKRAKPSGPVLDLAAHPSLPGVLSAATLRGIEQSSDGGETWVLSGGFAGPRTCWTVAVDPSDGDRILAGCEWLLWRSDDGGGSWNVVPTALNATEILQIEAADGGQRALYLRSASSVIVASFDDGATWGVRSPPGQKTDSRRLLAPATGPSRVFAGTTEGLFASQHSGESWSFLSGLGATNVSDLAAEGSSGRLFAVNELGLLASEDGGGTWAEISPQIRPSLVAVDPLRPGTLYAWGPTLGFSRSVDSGETWDQRGHVENDCMGSIVAHPSAADTFFGASSCCFGSTEEECGGVLRSTDGWATREVIRGTGTGIALTPSGTLFIGDIKGVFRSRDLGESWKLVSNEVKTYAATAVLVDPTDPRVIYAGVHPATAFEAGAARMIVSEDGGESWVRQDLGLPEDSIVDLAIDPRRPEYVYAATRKHGVYRLQRREFPSLPDPPPGDWLESAALPGFRVKVRITAGAGDELPTRREPACIPETLCVSGAVPGRSEAFVRVLGPKPNGYLWPTLVKFSTSTVEVWIEQRSSGVRRYYRLEGASPGSDELPGLFDRTGFLP